MKALWGILLMLLIAAAASAEVRTTKPCPLLDKRNGVAIARLDAGTEVDTSKTIGGFTQVRVVWTGTVGWIPADALADSPIKEVEAAGMMATGMARADSIWIQPSRFDELGLFFGGANPYSRTWKAYMGYETIGEYELFKLAGEGDLARRSDLYSKGRGQQIVVGVLMDIGGTCVMVFPGSKPEGGGYLVGGAVASVIGFYLWFSGALKPERFAPYQVAQKAADTYNASR